MNELRADGRTLTGVAVRYGDTARVIEPRSGRMVTERIAAGAFQPLGHVVLEMLHRRDNPVTMTPLLELDDSAERLALRAEIPHSAEGDALLEGVNAGQLSGLSVDMQVLEDDLRDGQRIVQRAALQRIAAVPLGAYPTTVETRQAIGTLTSTIPFGVQLDCECHRSSDADTLTVEFDDGAFDAALDSDRRFVASAGDFKTEALGSTEFDTLRMRKTRNGLEISLDLPDTQAGRDLRELTDAVPVLIRPLFNQDRSEYDESDGVARYRSLYLRAFLVGTTSADGGWTAAAFTAARAARRSLDLRDAVWL